MNYVYGIGGDGAFRIIKESFWLQHKCDNDEGNEWPNSTQYNFHELSECSYEYSNDMINSSYDLVSGAANAVFQQKGVAVLNSLSNFKHEPALDY